VILITLTGDVCQTLLGNFCNKQENQV